MNALEGGAPSQFLAGQRVRVTDEARGEHYPDEGHWIALAEYAPEDGQVLYGLTTTWPPSSRQEVQEGFYASDLRLWAD